MSPPPLAQIKGGAWPIKDTFFKRPTGSSLPTSSVAVRISSLRMASRTLPSSQQNSFSYRTSLSTSAPTSQYILVSCWKNPPALKLQHSFFSFTQSHQSSYSFATANLSPLFPPRVTAGLLQELPALRDPVPWVSLHFVFI